MVKNSSVNINGIILAAGEGKRLKPLGANIPKVMLPVLGRPVLEYVVKNLIEAGIKSIIIVVSKDNQKEIKKYFGENFGGAKIDYVVQQKQLGPAQAIILALPKIKSEYFLVQYGDSLADQNIAENLVRKLSQNPKVDGILAVRDVEDPSRYGIVKYQDDRVVEIIEKPKSKVPSSQAVIGTFILKTETYKEATKKTKFVYGKEEFPTEYILRIGSKIITWKFDGKRVDVGKPENLFDAGQLLATKPIKCIAFDADNTLYNSHQAAPPADIAAMELLSKKAKTTAWTLYNEWSEIIEKIKNSKNPKIRTRLYSYGELCSRYFVKSDLAREMHVKFTNVLLKNLKPAKDISEILRTLIQDKYVITDDIKQLADKKLKRLDLREFFKKVITSDEVGTMKPSRKFYEQLSKNFDPQEILVVGDNWQKDLEIPAQLGMQILFVENSQSLKKLLHLSARYLRIHIMGIAGAGASAIAGIAKEYGYQVTGCDLIPESPYTQHLRVNIKKGHNPAHVDDIDMLVVSPAVLKLDPSNQEVKKAKKLKIPILTWQEFQGKFLQKDNFVITVAGAYGKSTTTAMISRILMDAGFDPTCEIGAKVLDWGKNFRVGKSNYLSPQSAGLYICEGDEYNNNFLGYYPDIAVILNVAWDHPDFFKSKSQLLASYQKFINNIKANGTLIISKDKELEELAKKARGDIKVVRIKDYGITNLKIIGDFRTINANAAATAAEILGVDITRAKSSLEKFNGVGRRLEAKGEIKNVKFYDDYAVQPYTILATADALKEKYSQKKILLVLEPHTFSRIETFFGEFVTSLQNSKVDQIFVTDVYAAREKGNKKALSQKLAKIVGAKAKYTGSIEETADYVRIHIKDFDVICSMGAGDSYKLYDSVGKT